MIKSAIPSGFCVQRYRCATCIYRGDSPLDLSALEDAIRDSHGGFRSYRICHHSRVACCRGFWDKHKNEFTLGQIAQRLNQIKYVDEDLLERITAI
jgi:hypothetical protein